MNDELKRMVGSDWNGAGRARFQVDRRVTACRDLAVRPLGKAERIVATSGSRGSGEPAGHPYVQRRSLLPNRIRETPGQSRGVQVRSRPSFQENLSEQ